MERPRHRIVIAFAIVQILVGGSVLGYRWMTTSTEADVSAALDRYREQGTPVQEEASADEPALEVATSPEPVDGDAPVVEEEGEAVEEDQVVVTPPPGATFSQAPDAGVYAWAQEGSEQVGNLNRDLPERSVRVVTRSSGTAWTDEHRYSEEHVRNTEWLVDDRGVAGKSLRTRITFGPFSNDQTVVFDPPMRVGVFPMQEGQRWEGSFTGPTSGSYKGHTFERTKLRVGDEQVDVFGIEVFLEMEGEVSGTATTKVWVSPKYRMVVKEFQEQSARSSGMTYTARWTITLLSIRPQR